VKLVSLQGAPSSARTGGGEGEDFKGIVMKLKKFPHTISVV